MGEFHGNQHTDNEFDGYTYAELVADTRELAAELDETPTTRDVQADDRFPCLARLYSLAGDDGWLGVLRDAGLQKEKRQVDEYGDQENSAICADMQRVLKQISSDHLTTRAYREHGEYATSTVKLQFGSWADACEVAGIEPGQKHGHECTGPAGAQLDSRFELKVAQFLYDNDISYRVHPKLEDTPWTGDFYVPDKELWIEVDGYLPGSRPNARSFQQKVAYFEKQQMNYIVVDSQETFQPVLETKLSESRESD